MVRATRRVRVHPRVALQKGTAPTSAGAVQFEVTESEVETDLRDVAAPTGSSASEAVTAQQEA